MYQKTLPYVRGIKYFIILFLAVFSFHSSFSQNAIVTENALTGSPASVWDIPTQDAGDLSIQGFATDISVNAGGTINFKIDVNTGTDKTFNISIYRIGYYQGNGARLIADLGPGFTFNGIAQNACSYNNTTGLTDCGNWTTTASWVVPSNAVSGLYIAKLTRSAAGGGGTSHIPFVVRNDPSTSAILFKTSDATWQAYNVYGGTSLYVGAGVANNHASKVSYNRPFITRSGNGGGAAREDWFMNAEYPMIRFLESNGFDVSYTTDLDIVRNNVNNVNLLLNHKIFLSTGHDEYWSKEERNSVEAAKAAGKNLAFFSGNEVYWKTRWENSVDGSNTPFRTMVCYKEGTLPTPAELACGGKCDVSTLEWTGLWRDGCNYPGVVDACKPENALTGQISWDGNAGTISVPSTYKNLRFWRNTPNVATMANGSTIALTNGTLGYEWDWYQYPASYPPGRVTMSSTTLDGRIHNLSLYKDVTSKALVFGAGTVQWAWGLDANHDINELSNGGPADQNMQQATINLLADMGAQPGSIKSPLTIATQSTDVTPPVTVITAPANGATITLGATYNIKGTVTDVGGVVAGVEVSVDGGLTWQAATGTSTWTYAWLPNAQGTVTIKSRAFDDIGNLESPGGSEGSANTVTVTVAPGAPPTNCPCSVFTQPVQSPTNSGDLNQHDPEGAITLGVKITPSFDGKISGIRFFKAPLDGANRTTEYVRLYAISPDDQSAGAPLTPKTFAPASQALTAGQWNEISFATPVSVTAGTVYVATYYSPTGYYNSTDGAFVNPVVNGPLAIIKDGDQGDNGAYTYGEGYPTDGYQSSNYWVDVTYSNGIDITPPTVVFNTPTTNATNITVNTSISVTFSENIFGPSVTSSSFYLKDAGGNIIPGSVTYSAGTRTASLVLNSPLDYSSVYTATVSGGSSGINDLSGNDMVSDYTWSFTTEPVPPIPSDDGLGGPILIISNSTNPYSRYQVEILRAQGYTAFKAVDITEVDATLLSTYDVVLLGQMTLSGLQVSMLSTWVQAGGTLIAQRPTSLLYPLLGITSSGTTLTEDPNNHTYTYLLVNTSAGQPGAGIVNQTIRFHGAADLYSMMPGTISLATLYTSATAATANPAVTSVSVGTNGGKAIAFAFDLPKSIILTRQGNSSWAKTSRDGQTGPIRSDNLFFSDYVDFNKIQIPQADEQQHLLTNIILLDNLHKKPLPHLWILPSGLKAAVVMTGDDHNNGSYPGSSGTAGRFNEYRDMSADNSQQAVDDWKAIRGTSYVFNGISMDDDSAAYYQSLGFEIALHPNTNCLDFADGPSLNNTIASQWSQLHAQLPSLNAPVTNRTHCMPWSDWSSQPTVENGLGIRFDVNYYYWPANWIQNRPGLFTGSGMPMRFADFNGNLIDCYQAPTQMPDESGLDITNSINTLLDNAINKGYYGAFVMNMHTDTAIHVGSNEIIASATARNIPVISAKQMLTWLDGRNGVKFSNMAWDNVAKKLSFDLSNTPHNLQAMVPFNSADGTLQQVTENGVPVTFTTLPVKGIAYGFFPASSKSYVAIYSSTPLPVTLLNFTVTKQGDNAQLNWSTSSEENNKGFEIQRSTDQSAWTVLNFIAGAGNSQTQNDYQYLDQNLPAGTYYYRLRQVDYDGNSAFSKIVPVTFDDGLALELKQNRPNPFNNNTSITMVIPKAGRVQLMLYDQMGRPMQQLMDEEKMPGTYTVTVNKNGLSSGIYYYKMNALGQVIVKKMTVL